ncbi:unnamed protein product [Acanthoscelides obtectus]|uniref:THAP-type domain-containing protein n=1 Tax=Acanthoscelides obtectus TaxID=200917 RepID=A0A9P0M4K0_ACAOB|nr:unnamed protein product [Acanthoscelides obtectus]CAK1629284.1 hypothetical protein AOBTE_LOCUS5654 [Acanthoscelides obtectus]
MPKRCCVPGCKGNYEAELRSTPYRSVFRFPKNEELKSKWLASIPRKDWSPSKDSVVCDAHFQQAEIVRTETYVLQDGSANTVTLSRPKLSEGAVPSVFPNVPSCLSKRQVSSRTDPAIRQDKILQRHENLVSEFQEKDKITGFSDLLENYS